MSTNIPWTASDDEFDDLWDNEQTDTDCVPDMLATMYAQQLAHLQKYASINEEAYLEPVKWGELSDPATQAAIRENAGYVVEELYEAVNLLKNKPWKQTPVPVNASQFREELADVWHFVIQLHILAGISPLDIFTEYFRKSLINTNRQETGY